MSFKSILINEMSNDEFIKKIKTYTSLDDALLNLPSEYSEFYLKNMNKLNKKIKNLFNENFEKHLYDNDYHLIKLDDLSEEEIVYTTGMGTNTPSPEQSITKKINYKGQYLILTFNRQLNLWLPSIQFRSFITALKYIKKQADRDYTEI